ncbi:MAG TPA: hypothetical protein VFW15_00880 [Thermoanaerobaculia bacterium]|nr:hypothetical protein [Thermoanaerobaculia bacterium]
MRRRTSLLEAVLVGGFVAGALDIVYAFVFFGLRSGISPLRILQSIASGIMGRSSRDGGLATGALGLFLQFFIAISAAAVFAVASRYLPVLRRRPVLSGIVYGVVIYVVMNFVVVPLSAFPYPRSFPPAVLVTGLLVHMFLIGLPISLSVRRAFEPA